MFFKRFIQLGLESSRFYLRWKVSTEKKKKIRLMWASEKCSYYFSLFVLQCVATVLCCWSSTSDLPCFTLSPIDVNRNEREKIPHLTKTIKVEEEWGRRAQKWISKKKKCKISHSLQAAVFCFLHRKNSTFATAAEICRILWGCYSELMLLSFAEGKTCQNESVLAYVCCCLLLQKKKSTGERRNYCDKKSFFFSFY